MFRGAFAAAALAALLVVMPAGASNALSQTSPGASTLAAEGITWYVPDSARVGAPVHAAVAVLTGDGFATEMHQDLGIWVTLDDEVVVHTGSVHEHHGLHMVTVTPTKPGVLRFWADDGSGGHDDHAEVPAAEEMQARGVSAEVVVEGELQTGSLLDRSSGNLHWEESGASTRVRWKLELDDPDQSATALLTVRDDKGRLVASAWPHMINGEGSLEPAVLPGGVLAHAIVMPYPASNPMIFGHEVHAQASYDPVPPLAGTTGLGLAIRSCADIQGRLVLDPNTVSAGETISWQEHSDVRMHYLAEEPLVNVHYWMIPIGAQKSPTFLANTDHPFGYVAYNPPDPGLYLFSLNARLESGLEATCQEYIQILPEPAALTMGPGSLDVDLAQPNETSVDVTMRSVGADGSLLPHYEFDVHLVRLADDEPGMLAWRGKLHGHAGEVSFMMPNLVPGEYEMRVYPSPQDAGIPPLEAGPQGFMRAFTVGGDNVSLEDDSMGEAEAAPSPVVPFFVILLGIAVAIGTRRRAG